MMYISNQIFLNTIFKSYANKVHVTDFVYDPLQIPQDKILISWMGNHFQNYKFKQQSNQFYTISIFNSDEQGKARRRIALYVCTPVIVLDDVREKLSITEALKLPKPSYILETSQGSEQWGYILNEPCFDQNRVNNLLNGLVSNGLAPDGKDPGMKGVTRYVRLPDGYNTKSTKLLNGQPFKCRLLEWNPLLNTTLEDLAKPFNIDLDTQNTQTVKFCLQQFNNHPIFKSGLNFKASLSEGRYDITCPWISNHTDRADNGTAVFTNEDGSVGFKCHHGNCENKNILDLLNEIEKVNPGFKKKYELWRFDYCLKDENQFTIYNPFETYENNKSINEGVNNEEIEDILKQVQKEIPNTKKCRDLVAFFLRKIEPLSAIDLIQYHKEICDHMHWTKNEFSIILKDLRIRWYQKKKMSFYDSMIFIKDQNRIFDYDSQIFYSAESFQNAFANEDPAARKEALIHGRVEKVEKMDFCPKMPRIFQKDGIKYANGWNSNKTLEGVPGDCSEWLDHWDILGWGANKKHMLQFMAYTLLYPENKINHVMLLGGVEGTGKDFIITPLVKALGNYSTIINGNELLGSFNDYLFFTKYLHINEIELGDHKKAVEVSSNIKPLAASPPDKLRVNIKNITPIKVKNIVNVTMSTNSKTPIKLDGASRRFYAVWTDIYVRDSFDNLLPEWEEYWIRKWKWMHNGGVDNCIYYLRNCVDLSDFDPGQAPKMTDFLREIRESSKSMPQQTIEAFIENRIGIFKYDLVSLNEVVTTLKAGIIEAQSFTYTENTWFTPIKVSRVMSDIASCSKLRSKGRNETRLWAVRDKDKYLKMSMTERYEYYKNQKKGVLN